MMGGKVSLLEWEFTHKQLESVRMTHVVTDQSWGHQYKLMCTLHMHILHMVKYRKICRCVYIHVFS